MPDLNVAIEYDELYSHSSGSILEENKNYHLHKTQECEKHNIHLFHIFENEWVDDNMREIWKSVIRNKLGKSERIYARKCYIDSVSTAVADEFLTLNHLQGKCIASVNIGLFDNNGLVSLMTFGRSRYDKKIEWELIRFCNKRNTTVVGAASRLFKKFTKHYPGSVVSYADKRRSNGNLYKQLGFEMTHESGPNYFYYKDDMNLESRVSYQKHKLSNKLEIFDDEKTESENMYINGFRKIFDCGNQVWFYKRPELNFTEFFS